MSTETRRDHRYTTFSDLYKKNIYLVTQVITESVDRNGISQLAFRGWKTCRKDIVKRPKIDLQVMKGWRKELGPHCVHILHLHGIFNNEHRNPSRSQIHNVQ